MSPIAVLSIQFTLSLIAFALIAPWHVCPRIAGRPTEAALIPLLWVQVFRFAPLALYVPGQVDLRIPPDVGRLGAPLGPAAAAFRDLLLEWR